VYRLDLDTAPIVAPPDLPVAFSTSADAVAEILRSPREYDIEPHHVEYFRQYLAEGQVCFSGRLSGKVVFFGWAQFDERRPGGDCRIPIPKAAAFIYRCFTHPDYRGHGVYPAALAFMFKKLRSEGFQTVYIDHATDNVASQRGIAKLGAELIGGYVLHKFAGRRRVSVDPELIGKMAIRQPEAAPIH
jgi:RimJ/RimL family protein N-acetyltransferase